MARGRVRMTPVRARPWSRSPGRCASIGTAASSPLRRTGAACGGSPPEYHLLRRRPQAAPTVPAMICVELAFTADPRRLRARPAHRQRLAQLNHDGVLLAAGQAGWEVRVELPYRLGKA
jgi:hypothetical protein